MEHALSKPFELLLDLTLFGQFNEIQNQWISQFLQLLPFDSEHNLMQIYFYNTNSAFKKYSKKIVRQLPNKLAKRSIFSTTLVELHDYIAPNELSLPKYTSKLIKLIKSDSRNGEWIYIYPCDEGYTL